MKYSAGLRDEAIEYLGTTFSGRRLRPELREAVAAATLHEFIAQTDAAPWQKPMATAVRHEVEQYNDVKQFLPFLLTVFVGWAISKLLDWLWERYAREMNIALGTETTRETPRPARG